MLERIRPRQANNDYSGSPIALWAFWLLMVPLTFRSFVHFLKDDSGVNSIATIMTFPGTPDPNVVIYMFSSAWGSQQLIMLLVYFVVLLRYRTLLPLMYVLFILENVFRLVVGMLHPLTAEYFERTPPGQPGTFLFLAVGVIMLLLSLRSRREAIEAEPVRPLGA